MIILLLTILKFALFLAFTGGLALLIGSAFASFSQLGNWAAARITPDGLDPAVAAALDCKSDLARGQRETADILAGSHAGCSQGGVSSGSDAGCDGGCDGGASWD